MNNDIASKRELSMSDRNNLIDYIKAFAIVLVVIGHSIQYGSGHDFMSNHFWDDVIVRIIYSFHMPLFLLISGYLFRLTVKKYKTLEIIKKKALSLLVPIASWSVFVTLIDVCRSDKTKLLDLWYMFKFYLNEFIGQFWFLWAIFFCSAIVAIVNRLFKDNIVIYCIIYALCFVTPDIITVASLYKFSFPFFIIGYFLNNEKFKAFLKKKRYSTIISLILLPIYTIMLVFMKNNYFIYNSGFTLIGKDNPVELLYISFYRLVLGVIGSYLMVYVFVNISSFIKGNINKLFLLLGKNTMGIYIVSYFIAIALTYITYNLSGVNYFITLFEVCITLLICFLVIWIIKKSSITSFLFLGIRNNKS